jgi:cell wall-associated NlpC family hydrolase
MRTGDLVRAGQGDLVRGAVPVGVGLALFGALIVLAALLGRSEEGAPPVRGVSTGRLTVVPVLGMTVSGTGDGRSAESGPVRDAEVPPSACTVKVGDVAGFERAVTSAGPGDVVCMTGAAARPAATSAVAFAHAQLGEPYRWAGNGPADGGFDCSGLTTAAFASAGIRLPRTAQAQFDAGPRLRPGQPIRPGDLVFYGAGPKSITHVGLAISATKMINAPETGDVVKVSLIKRPNLVGVTRPAPLVLP